MPLKVSLERANTYIGRIVNKEFPPNGFFSGEVTEVNSHLDDAKDRKGPFFRIAYEDGDGEDVDWDELQRILDPPDDGDVQPSHKKQPKKRIKREPVDEDAPGTSAAAERAAKPRVRKPPKHHPASDDYEEEPATGRRTAKSGKRQAEHHEEPSAKRGRGGRAGQQQQHDDPAGDLAHEDDQVGDDDELSGEAEQEVDEDAPSRSQAVRSKGLPGHLAKIKLENFMCHENFEMDFGPHVTFISGTNGSGKSAVLQALQVCLGASARSTGRSASLGNFIRTGAHEARVQVTLWNTGADAYQRSKLGDKVTIERRIGNTNSWKLMDARGRTVGTKKREHIDPMLDHFSINAANPLAVMTQDTARTFLSGGAGDRKKYELFMQATLLQEFKDNLASASAHLQAMYNIVREMLNVFKEARAKRDEVAERLKKLQEGEGLAQRRQLLTRAWTWAQVQECQHKVAEYEQHLLVTLPENKARLEHSLLNYHQKLSKLQQQKHEQEAQVEELNAGLQGFAAQVAEMKSEERSLKRQLADAQHKVQDVQSRMEEAQETKDALLSGHDNDRSALRAEYERAMAQHNARMQQVKAQQHSLQSQLDEARHGEEALDAQLEELRNRLKGLRGAKGQADSEYRSMQDHLRELQGSSKSNVASFGGQAVRQLLQLIQQHQHEFSAPPIGPIGAYLRVTDSQWALPVEAALGKNMESFVCANNRDFMLIKKLGQRCGYVPSCLIVDYDLPAYTVRLIREGGKEVGGGQLISCYRVLVAEHPQPQIIMNALLDNVKVERIALSKMTLDRLSGNYEGATTIVGPDGRSLQLRGAGGRTQSRVPYRGPRVPRLSSSVAGQLAQLQAALAASAAESQRLAEELQQVSAQLAGEEARKRDMARKLKEAHTGLRASQRDMQRLVDQVPQMEAGGDDDTYLQSQVHELDVTIAATQVEAEQHSGRRQQLEARLQELVARRDAAVATNSGAMEQMKAISAALESLGADIDHMTGEVAACEALLDAVQRETQQYQVALEQAHAVETSSRDHCLSVCSEEEGLEALVALREEFRAKFARLVAEHVQKGKLAPEQQAATIEANVAKNMDREMLGRQLATVQRKLQEMEAEAGGSRAELEAELKQAELVVAERQPAYERLAKTYGRIKDAYNERQASYKQLFEKVAAGVSEKFRGYMQRRQHTGTIDIDEESDDLRLKVKIGGLKNKQAKTVHDLKQLSGGERSYTTVSFILALGHWTESPWRAMDEYDVYMDAINRRVSTETLLEFALDNADLQFIFLTPQDMQAVKDAQVQLEQRTGRAVPEEYVRIRLMRPARNS